MPLIRALNRASLLVVMTTLVVAACSSEDSCEDGPFGGATCTVGGQIVTGDVVLFNGEVVVYAASAVYGIGPGLPTATVWTTSDPTVLEVESLENQTARVTALDTGAAWVIVLINAEFVDSARVTVTLPGAARWRHAFGGVPLGVYPALGADSLVRVVTGGAAPALWVFTPDSGVGTSAPSCFSALGPSLGTSDVAYATGVQCTRQHGQDGDSVWAVPVGSAALGVAVAEDGGAFTVSGDSLYRLGASGAVAWAAPLGGTPRTAPVVGPGGDVYVGWAAGGADSVSRFGIDREFRWSVAVPGLSPGSPAVAAGRLIFGRPGGLFALDSVGTIAWDRAFNAGDVNPAATATSRTSSPVHDGLIAFVQNEEALYSFALDGTFLWYADSLGYGPTTEAVGAPVLLSGLLLVVPCASSSGREVCAVEQVNGRLSWRSPLGDGSVNGLAVGRNGMIFATRTLTSGDSELAALWGRVGPSTVGWPAEGGNQQHTRRR
jgi:hypothetical protein